MQIRKLTLGSALLLSMGLFAQTKPCFSMNDTTNAAANFITAKSFAGPGYWALRWTPGSTYVAQSLSIFTGSKFLDGYHSLEFWSHDSTASAPKARLSGGSFFLPKGSLAGWYGSNLDKVQLLTKGTTYWIVWGEPGWSAVPHQVGGKPILPLMRRVGTTGSWTASSAGWGFKFRLFCTRRDLRSAVPFGNPCTGSRKALPTSFTNVAPKIGTKEFRVEGTGLPSGAAAFLILGGNKNFKSIPLGALAPRCSLHTDIVLLVGGKTGTGNLQAKPSVGTVNHVSFGLPIPNSAALIGAFLGTQLAVFDKASSAPLPLLFTNGLRITVN